MDKEEEEGFEQFLPQTYQEVKLETHDGEEELGENIP